MPKLTTTEAAEPAEITLEEFCRDLSGRDSRVELLNGFYAYETATGGALKDTAEGFAARFAAFGAKPA